MSQVKRAELAKQAALNKLATEVYNPVFFAKLAQYGVVPQDEAQASSLLEAASQLRLAALQQFGAVSHGTPDPALVKQAYKVVRENAQIKAAAVIRAFSEE